MLRPLLLAAAAALGLALPAASDPIPVRTLSGYLNAMQAGTSEFTQISANGREDRGILHVQRPYRMRFEYSTQPVLLLASAGQVAIFDGKSNAGPQQYPMSKTPLSLILAPQIDLERQGAIVGHGEVGGNTIVTLRDPSGTTPGSVDLVFAPGPVLKQWTTTDELGQRTTVILSGMRPAQFPSSTFTIQNEIQRRER